MKNTGIFLALVLVLTVVAPVFAQDNSQLTEAQAKKIRYALVFVNQGSTDEAAMIVKTVMHQANSYELKRTLYTAYRELLIGTPATVEKAVIRLTALVN